MTIIFSEQSKNDFFSNIKLASKFLGAGLLIALIGNITSIFAIRIIGAFVGGLGALSCIAVILGAVCNFSRDNGGLNKVTVTPILLIALALSAFLDYDSKIGWLNPSDHFLHWGRLMVTGFLCYVAYKVTTPSSDLHKSFMVCLGVAFAIQMYAYWGFQQSDIEDAEGRRETYASRTVAKHYREEGGLGFDLIFTTSAMWLAVWLAGNPKKK